MKTNMYRARWVQRFLYSSWEIQKDDLKYFAMNFRLSYYSSKIFLIRLYYAHILYFGQQIILLRVYLGNFRTYLKERLCESEFIVCVQAKQDISKIYGQVGNQLPTKASELCGCVSSNGLHEKMISHMDHICNLCGLHELCGCVSSKSQHEKMIYHKIDNGNL